MFILRTFSRVFALKRSCTLAPKYFISTTLKSQSKRPVVPTKYTEASGFSFRRTAGRLTGKKRPDGSKKGRLQKEYLYGISPCLAALKANRRKIHELNINLDAQNMNTRSQFKEMISMAKQNGIQFKHVPRERLDNLCKNRPHQNVVLKVDQLVTISLEKDSVVSAESTIGDATMLPENVRGRSPCWIFLDGIQDPMNFGGILRTAAYFGIDRVIISDKYSCSLTPAVSKASAGVMETLPVYSANALCLLKELRHNGWSILGSVHPYSESPNKIVCHEYSHDKPCVLVLGNEGKGLSTEVEKFCTHFLTIPSTMTTPDLDSLNVSVASGILLYYICLKRTRVT